MVPRQTTTRDHFKVLRQVVAKRRKDHGVDSVRCGVDCRRCLRCRGVRSRPCISANVGNLRAELNSALGTVVGFDPATERPLDCALDLVTAAKRLSWAIRG